MSDTPPSFRPSRPARRPEATEGAAIPVGRQSRPASRPVRRAETPTPARPAVSAVRPDRAAPAVVPPRNGRSGATPPAAASRAQGRTAPPGEPPHDGRRRRRRRLGFGLAAVAALLLAWPLGLLLWANGKIQHVDALSGTPDSTPGTTYLLAGSDARGGEDGIKSDSTVGERTDTMMILHVPTSGPAALISLPRDTYAEIPGHDAQKLNAAYAFGGAPLLVSSVEGLTGMHIDHYVEVGLGGISQIVDAVGGVELCFDPEVDKVDFPIDDNDSKLEWAEPGCKTVDGTTAVAYSRMRKADREGDIGRARRQQRLVSAVTEQVADRSLVVKPTRQVALIDAGLGALRVDDGTDIVDLGRLALAFRAASGPDGIRGTPPIANPDYRPGGVGSTVLLDPETAPGFFAAITDGTLEPGTVGGLEG